MEPGTLPYPRVTPWVLRLLALLAGIQVLRATIFTSDALLPWLWFDPAAGLARPWTVVTYGFIHGGFFHLLFNALALFIFGPAVERRLGGPAFLLYFLYCVVGAAAFALIVNKVSPVPPFIGASGGIMGLLLAYATFWPDQELIAFPIPIPIRARTMVILLAIFDACGVLFLRNLFHTGLAHEAHLGGLAFGWLFFRLQGAGKRTPDFIPPKPKIAHHVAVGGREADRLTARPPDRRPPALDKTQAELDRVLDKISAKGMKSLTPEERRFLDEVAKKKQDS